MKNWKKIKLGTLLTESKVVSEKPNPDKRIRVKLNVLGVEKRPITKDKRGATKYYIRKSGQFVYGKQNLHKGAFGIIPDEMDGFESSLDIPAFNVDETCYPEWIFYFFKKGNFYLKLESIAKGVGSKRIHPKQIFELDIFLPSKEEQKKVLDEIEKAEKNNQELVTEIKSQEENLTKLRQSILQDAIQGKLTKKWRNDNNKSSPKIEEIHKYDIAFKFEIPSNWKIYAIGNIMKFQQGMQIAKSSRLKEPGDGTLPILRIKNYRDGFKSDVEHIRIDKNSLIAEKDDLILTRTGESRGWVLTGYKGVFHNNTFRINYPKDKIVKEYLHYYLNSNSIQSFIKKNSGRSAQPDLSHKKFGPCPFVLPPLEEQETIVEKVNQLLSHCDDLEQEIKASKISADKLMQSVLSELLRDENNILLKTLTPTKDTKKPLRDIKYNPNTLLMDLVKLLKENGKLHAEDLWKMSKYPNNIDFFYAELKKQIEEEKTIKESVEKGYLELV